MNSCRNYILNYLWNIKVYSESSKIFQNKYELIILSSNNKILCNIKSLESGRIAFNFLSDDVFCEIGTGTVHFSETNLMGIINGEENILACHDVTSLDLKRAKSLILSGLNICEECLGKSLNMDLEKQLILISELLKDCDVAKEEKICDLCGDNRECIFEILDDKLKVGSECVEEIEDSIGENLGKEYNLDKKE